MTASSPPEVLSAEVSSSWPFVSVERRHERKREYRDAAAMSIVSVAALVAMGAALPAALMSTVAGYLLHGWLTYDDLYGRSD